MPRQEGAKTKILRYLKEHVGEQVPRSVLKEIVNNVGGWERSLRSLRDDGYIVDYNKSTKCYCLPYEVPTNEPKDKSYISKDLRALVLIRDKSTCQMCGKTVREDHIKVQIDHVVPRSWGGKTELENLQVLCRECNEGKKNFVKSEAPDLMIEIGKASSTEERLRLYFEYYKNEPIEVDRLAVIARTREWTRSVRYLRPHYNMDIEFVPKNKKKNIVKEYYIYHAKEQQNQ